jgi:hypothetical protein
MITQWNKILTTDCIVVKVGPHTIYPIFRVGHTTLMSVCDKKYVNEEITNCDHIDVMIRNPEHRFVSGVNEYCRHNNRDVRDIWELIQQGKLVDRHFAPQYLWLLHLYKFYKGEITIRPFDYIKQITSVHKKNSNDINQHVPLLKSFLDVDHEITKHYNQTLELGELIERYRNVLSQA